MTTKQISIEERGVRSGPRPIGDERDRMIPTYRLIKGAGVSLDTIREAVTLLPVRSKVSS
jgi:hypothetical protein